MIVLVEAASARPDVVALAEGEEHHLRVRRAEDGARVDLRDGAGLMGTGRLLRRNRGWTVEVHTARRVGRTAPLMLAVGAGDRERFEWLVEKATELGVTCVVPIETERAVAVTTRLRGTQLDKLRRRALETVKQCGAAWAPAIAGPESLVVFLARGETGARWLADTEGGKPGAEGSSALSVIVGPEGGLTEGERDAARAAGYRPVKLADNILRFETAAIAAAALAAAARAGAQGAQHG
jgi:16S rRNA (uracil1498-N3)-methyltransferase